MKYMRDLQAESWTVSKRTITCNFDRPVMSVVSNLHGTPCPNECVEVTYACEYELVITCLDLELLLLKQIGV